MAVVVESQEPLLVKIGIRSWNAIRVPVGRRLAKWAELSSTRREIEGGGVGCCSGGGGESESGGGFVVADCLCLRDIGL